MSEHTGGAGGPPGDPPAAAGPARVPGCGAWVHDGNLGLFCDLYELTMAAAYRAGGRTSQATFELFVRELPPDRGYLVVAGTEQVVDELEVFRFDDDAVGYLASLGRFDEATLAELAALRFTGEVWTVDEGEVVGPGVPLVRVTAPVIEAQLVETLVLNTVGFQTMVATKAARVAEAADGVPFVDFSARRDHGADAALRAARAAWIAGAAGTSLTLAGRMFGIPVSGTMAHSYVMHHDDELEAFLSFARAQPRDPVLLIDTYDTLEGARLAARAADILAGEGITVRAVRIDSGDLPALATAVRSILDAAGHPEIGIFLSGDLDEHRVAGIRRAGVPVDGFGVGTRMGTSEDAPWLGVVYKLTADDRGPRIKRSAGKATLPGVKQLWRPPEGPDILALADEPPPPGARPLLVRRMADGRRIRPAPPLEEARSRCARARAALDPEVRRLRDPRPLGHTLAAGLARLAETMGVRG